MTAIHERAPGAANAQGSGNHTTPKEYGEPSKEAEQHFPSVCSAVTVALALEELDRLKALERLPDPETLMERLRARSDDFNLLAGVAGAYLSERGLVGGRDE